MTDLWPPSARARARRESAALLEERRRIAEAVELKRAEIAECNRRPSRTKTQWVCPYGQRNNTRQRWCIECGDDREETR